MPRCRCCRSGWPPPRRGDPGRPALPRGCARPDPPRRPPSSASRGRPGPCTALRCSWPWAACGTRPPSAGCRPRSGRPRRAGSCKLEEAGVRNVRNPVIGLDEIDKVGGRTHNHGDPSAALLELLDREQNTRFRDVYLDVPFDLFDVLFIATANDLAAVPACCGDRLEVIEAPGYTDDEKVDIVRRTLWRDRLGVAGLSATGFWTRTPTAGHRAYFGGSGTPISAEVEHRFRPKWNTDFGMWNTDFGMWNIHSGGSGTPFRSRERSSVA